jgi:restriction endonuclease S subunit
MNRWPTRKLGEVARIRRGASPRPKGDPRYFGGDIPWLKIGDVPPGSRFVSQTEEGVTPAGRDLSVYVEPGTLLLSNSASVGRPVITRVGACIHDGWLAIDGYESKLRQDFLYWCLIWSHSQFQQLAPSGTQKNLNIGLVNSFEVAVPPLAEQERIVKLLDEADELRKLRAQADRRIAALIPALFNEMFGDPARNPKGWPELQLVEVTSPKQWPTITQHQLTESGFPVYGANGRIGFYSEFNHEEQTVLVTCRGATCGTINVCEPNSYVTGNAMSLDDPNPALLNVPYLEFVLRVRGVQDTITGTAQPQITRQSLARVSFPAPPLPLQREFAQQVTAIRDLEAAQAASRQRLEALFQSMLHRAFNGEL